MSKAGHIHCAGTSQDCARIEHACPSGQSKFRSWALAPYRSHREKTDSVETVRQLQSTPGPATRIPACRTRPLQPKAQGLSSRGLTLKGQALVMHFLSHATSRMHPFLIQRPRV